MLQETKILLEEYKKEYESYAEFLKDNDWIHDVYLNASNGKLESDKFNTEKSVIKNMLDSLKRFLKDIGDDSDSPEVSKFVEESSKTIELHLDRIRQYKLAYPIDVYSTESDVEFHSDLFSILTKVKIEMSNLGIGGSFKSSELFFADMKAPITMREMLVKLNPVVANKTQNTGVDFGAPFVNPATSNEMFINMKPSDIPPWDTSKHFFEQEKSTIEFWEEELRKMRNGINVYGYHISAWLYWHLNHFKLAYIDKETGDKIVKQPIFRDNEYYFDQMYHKALEHGRCGIFMYGTRRFSKSIIETSHLAHKLYTIPRCEGTLQGFTKEPDIRAIYDYLSNFQSEVHPALKLDTLYSDIDKGMVFGLKGKNNQIKYELSRLKILNLESGNTKRGTQKTAGSTPDVFILDECGKGAVIAPWKAALASFAGGKGGNFRCVPLLSGTAGESELSQDAETMLKNPSAYNILPMNWDVLDTMVDPEHITWKSGSVFGMFVPAQMSIEGLPKITKKFSQFLGNSNKGLAKIDIDVTDWSGNKEFFMSERDSKSSDLAVQAAYINSFPMDVEDCYLTTEVNIFPGIECKNRKSYIQREGLTGQTYKLYKNSSGVIVPEMVTPENLIVDYPYKGGNVDAPVVMFEDPRKTPDDEPPMGLYVMGLDDIKVDTSSGDSVASATIFKRKHGGGEWANRIVAYYDSRPERKEDYYRQLYLLMKYFNARVLYENADNGFIDWVESNHFEDVHKHFSTGVGLASEENVQVNKNRKYGWQPTAQNIYLLNSKLVAYTKEDNVQIGDVEGLSGVDRINHPMLLEEMYKYKKDNNCDRIRSFGLAYTLARYYDNTFQYLNERRVINRDQIDQRRAKTRQVYGGLVYDTRLNSSNRRGLKK